MKPCLQCGQPVKTGQRIYCSRKCFIDGSIIKDQYDTEKIAQSFWGKVSIKSENECWPISGKAGKNGYVSISRVFGKRQVGAHRIAYMLSVGPISKGMVVKHSCDNKICCNPAHLSLGTIGDNVKEAADRFLMCQGESHRDAKLKVGQVKEILTSVESHVQLANRYGVHRTTILRIRKKETWKSIMLP